MGSVENRDQFSEFLLREYDNIASAYFNIKNSISLFFRYYILIASVPITVFLFLLDKKTVEQSYILSNSDELFSGLCLLIMLVGFGLMMYVLSMNFTATLYARQVNGIRYYYYSKNSGKSSFEEKVRVLPLDNRKPAYSLLRSVKYLLLAFSAINAFYYALGVQFLYGFGVEKFMLNWVFVMIFQGVICLIRVAVKVGKD